MYVRVCVLENEQFMLRTGLLFELYHRNGRQTDRQTCRHCQQTSHDNLWGWNIAMTANGANGRNNKSSQQPTTNERTLGTSRHIKQELRNCEAIT